jgi:hypothetical protein
MTLIAALVFTLAIAGLATVVTYFIKDIKNGSPVSSRCMGVAFTTDELEEARKYATLFGLNNEHDINVEELLQMGRKYAEFLGEDKLDDLVSIVESTVCFEQHHEYKGEHHLINIIMAAHSLITVPCFITVVTKCLGGDRDGEPNSSIC